VVITGDFNCVEDAWGCRYLTDAGFIADSMTSLPEDQRKNWEYYTAGTYRPVEKLPQTYKHVDHIFYTPSHIEVLTWAVDPDTIHDGKYSSDHLPVTADLKFYK
jgi:endonuclease/exonuclease/phosphatase family metal-dependent hydrolase